MFVRRQKPALIAIILTAVLLSPTSGLAKSSAQCVAAGVPLPIGKQVNYDSMLGQLKGAGIDVLMPYSQYRELPSPKSLGWEVDFFPRFKRNDSAKQAILKHKVRLLVPAVVLYQDDDGKVDRLRELIDWLGRDSIFAVYTLDEPSFDKGNLVKCKQLYERVKKTDPTMPVVMVHGPIPEACDTPVKIDEYLKCVKESSRFADIVGFDVYPVPTDLMKVRTPKSRNAFPPPARAVREYLDWLKTAVPGKEYMIVLQAFCLKDQGANSLVAAFYGDRRPTEAELKAMLDAVVGGGAIPAWWGQSMLKEDGMKFWQSVLNVTRTRQPD